MRCAERRYSHASRRRTRRESGRKELVTITGAGQANVSKHLGLLHRHRIVGRRKDGLNVYYRITDPAIFEICELMCTSLESELEVDRRALVES